MKMKVVLILQILYWEKILADLDVACVRAEDQGMFHFFDQDPHVKVTGMLTQVETKSIAIKRVLICGLGEMLILI